MFNLTEIDNQISLYHGDCLEVMPFLAARGVKADLILSDPPYGTTHCRWDSVIDIPMMWSAIRNVCRDCTPVLLFCQQPFTSVLGNSNLRCLRYNWVWEKTTATGFLNANRMPLKSHEDVLVFYCKSPLYHPLKTTGHNRKVVTSLHRQKCQQGEIYREHNQFTDYDSTERYPRTVLKFSTDKQTCYLHPTQKPVALLEYFIRTYTNEGDLVIDFAMGSGSTGVACRNTGRKFIGIEKEEDIFQVAKERLTL